MRPVVVRGTVWTSTSYHEPPLDLSYPHRIVAVRVFDGAREDPVFRSSMRAAAELVRENRLAAVIATIEYRPQDEVRIVRRFEHSVVETLGAVPQWLAAMIEIDERGCLAGHECDHSEGLNRLWILLARLLSDDPRRVLGHGNRRGLTSVWPSRPAQMSTVVADFGESRPQFQNLIGWHYTNGEHQVADLPMSSAPFGRCDHTVAPGLTPAQLVEAIGALSDVPTDPLEEVMAMYVSKAAFEAMLDDKLGIDPTNADNTGRVDLNGLLAFWLVRHMVTLRKGTPNKAFSEGPEEVVDGSGLDGALTANLAALITGAGQTDLEAGIAAAVSAAVEPLATQIAQLQRTIDEAINIGGDDVDLSQVE